MKKVLLSVITALVICSYSSAQDLSMDTTSVDTSMVGMQEMMNKMFTNDVKIEIDTVLFPIHQASFYMTDATPTPAAVIMTLILPQPFDQVIQSMNVNASKGMNMTIKTNETLVINNKTATHISGSSIIDGKTQLTEIYVIRENENQTLMITGVFNEATSAKYIGSAKKAAYSAYVENK